MEGQWTRGTVVNQDVAAGRSSPTKVITNGIQGGHFLPRNETGGSPQSRAAMIAIRSSQPQQQTVPNSRSAMKPLPDGVLTLNNSNS